MKQLLKIVGVAACLRAVLATLGGDWFALQSVAWARMVVDYSRQGSVAKAIQSVFDGAHPCSVCLKIREGLQQEQKHENKLPWLHGGMDCGRRPCRRGRSCAYRPGAARWCRAILSVADGLSPSRTGQVARSAASLSNPSSINVVFWMWASLA